MVCFMPQPWHKAEGMFLLVLIIDNSIELVNKNVKIVVCISVLGRVALCSSRVQEGGMDSFYSAPRHNSVASARRKWMSTRCGRGAVATLPSEEGESPCCLSNPASREEAPPACLPKTHRKA